MSSGIPVHLCAPQSSKSTRQASFIPFLSTASGHNEFTGLDLPSPPQQLKNWKNEMMHR